jgi:hypothetical protein
VSNDALFSQSKLIYLLLWTALCTLGRAFPGRCAQSVAQSDNLQRAKVVVVKDPEAIEAYKTRPERIRAMLDRGMTNITSRPTPAEAWRSLLATNDVVGIKVFSLPGPNSGTRPAVVAGLVEQLLAAGLPATNIVVWDRQSVDLRLAGYYELSKSYGIRVVGSMQSGFDTTNVYENPLLGNLVWGDFEFGNKGEGVGRKSYVSKLVSQQLTKIINVSPLLNHTLAGVSGNLYGLASGSLDNIARFETDSERMARTLPEIYALPSLSDRVVMNIVDALICQYEGGERGLLHYSTIINEIRLSKDPVALDVLSIQELDRQRQMSGTAKPKASMELYDIAALLELGVNDPKRIDVETLRQ